VRLISKLKIDFRHLVPNSWSIGSKMFTIALGWPVDHKELKLGRSVAITSIHENREQVIHIFTV